MPDSIRATAHTLTTGVLSLYTNGAPTTPLTNLGLFPYPPYYWWQSGATWAGLVDYTVYTGDSSLIPTITTALLAQKGPDENYIVPAHRFDEGNDDQAFWGLGLMSALEGRFPEPAAGRVEIRSGWLGMLTALFDNQTARWDTSSCGGGLKWQIYPENNYGYNYKNAVSNGAYFQLAARLARYSGNPAYVALATRTWDWCISIGLINKDNFDVYDGSDDKLNCTELDHTRWSYNVALFLYGAASLYSHTGDPIWAQRVDGLLDAASVFFSPSKNTTDIMFEAACETHGTCNTDQYSFKAYLARWLGKTAVLAPWTQERILPWLRTSAKAAAGACSASPVAMGVGGGMRWGRSVRCGHKWYLHGDGWNATTGLGQLQSALEVVISLLAVESGLPFSPWEESTRGDGNDESGDELGGVQKRHGNDGHDHVGEKVAAETKASRGEKPKLDSRAPVAVVVLMAAIMLAAHL